jgi:hypothetical protein
MPASPSVAPSFLLSLTASASGASMADAEARDIHATTPNMGLTIVGPSSPDGGSSIATAYNAMATMDAKIAGIETKLASVAAGLAVLESVKK